MVFWLAKIFSRADVGPPHWIENPDIEYTKTQVVVDSALHAAKRIILRKYFCAQQRRARKDVFDRLLSRDRAHIRNAEPIRSDLYPLLRKPPNIPS